MNQNQIISKMETVEKWKYNSNLIGTYYWKTIVWTN